MQFGAGASSHVHTEGPPPLAGPITYRHILSAGTLNPTNPLRVIAHCDVDAAYAAFEAKRLGLDAQTVPLAVLQWRGILALTYPARKYGITRHETPEEAMKKSGGLIKFAHVATYAQGSDRAEYNEDPQPETHKVSLDPYRRESKKILEVFKRTCPAGSVEKASIDESFFDLTIEVRKAMLEEYPQLRKPPDNSQDGLDTPLPEPPQDAQALWTGLGHLIPIHGDVGEAQNLSSATRQARELKRNSRPGQEARMPVRKSDQSAAEPGAENGSSSDAQNAQPVLEAEEEEMEIEAPTSAQPVPDQPIEVGEEGKKLSQEEETKAILEVEDVKISWQDIALAVGAKLMNKVRTAVKTELTYTTSAGIANNKTMAKLCSSWRKPYAQTIMRPAAVRNFLKVLPFQKIRFLGGKLGDAMANEWQSATVGDLWTVTLEQMQAKFGEDSGWVYNVLRGVDLSEVKERVSTKSMLASKNVRPIITSWAQGQHWLSILSTELAIRLAEERETDTNLWPRTITLRYLRVGESGRSRQAAFPFTRELNAAYVRKAAEKLWRDTFGDLAARPSGGSLNVSPSKTGGQQAENEGAREIKPGIVTIALGLSGLEKAAESGQRRLDQAFFTKGSETGPSSSSNVRASAAGSAPSEHNNEAPSSDRITDATAVGSSSSDLDRSDPITSPSRKRQKRFGPLETMLQTQQQRSEDTEPAADVESSATGRASDHVKRSPSTSVVAPPKLAPKNISWTCSKCGETFQAPPIQEGEVPQEIPKKRKAPWPFDDEDEDEQAGNGTDQEPAISVTPPIFTLSDAEAWLENARVTHEDEHFAMQLQKEEERRNRHMAGSQAYAAARAAPSGSGSGPGSGSGSGSGSSAKGKAGAAGRGKNSGSSSSKAKGRSSESGSIASFFSQKSRN